MKWIVLVRTVKNGRIVDAFAMMSKGMEFFFQNSEGKWINPAMTDGYMKTAFKLLFDDDSEFLTHSEPLYLIKSKKYVVEVREI